MQYEKSKQKLKIMLTNWGRFHISVQFGKSFNKIDIEFRNSKYVAFIVWELGKNKQFSLLEHDLN